MRTESCLSCRSLLAQNAKAALPASLTQISEMDEHHHHHHVVICRNCGSWWFDDLRIDAFGLLGVDRRDTSPCQCPDDGSAGHLSGRIVQVNVPDAACVCTAALINEYDRQGAARPEQPAPEPRKPPQRFGRSRKPRRRR